MTGKGMFARDSVFHIENLPQLTQPQAPVSLSFHSLKQAVVSESAADSASQSYMCIFSHQQQILLDRNCRLPNVEQVFIEDDQLCVNVGSFSKVQVYLCIDEQETGGDQNPDFQLCDIRIFLAECQKRQDSVAFAAVLRAYHLFQWDKQTRFCGKSGQKNYWCNDELAKAVVGGQRVYPRLSPAIIVGVVKDGKLLMGKHPNRSFYSLIAGFVEPGETIEQAVHREIREEAGIEVGRLQYLGSQSWPFPDSLMLGFQAEWISGELCLDEQEIIAADWFDPEDLLAREESISIASSVIRKICQNLVQKL